MHDEAIIDVAPPIQPPKSVPHEPTHVIAPTRGIAALKLRELWEYRELLWLLIRRDVTVRYKQTILGASWAFVQPVINMVIFSVVFGNIANIRNPDGIPYPIFAFTALLPWNLFNRALTGTSSSLTSSAHLVGKVYFPRLILPLTNVIAPVFDFALSLIVLVGLMFWYQVVPTWHVILLPVFLLIAMVTALSVGLWFAAINVKYRDIGQIAPFLTQIWLYATPVAYPLSRIEHWSPTLKFLYSLNPMVSVVEGFRWAMLGKGNPDMNVMAMSLLGVILVGVGGLLFFKRAEQTFADVI